jgi:hypothetical protein
MLSLQVGLDDFIDFTAHDPPSPPAPAPA